MIGASSVSISPKRQANALLKSGFAPPPPPRIRVERLPRKPRHSRKRPSTHAANKAKLAKDVS